MADEIEGKVNATTDADSAQQPPPPPVPPAIERHENGEGNHREDRGDNVANREGDPLHWTRYLEVGCAVLLVLITGKYTYYAGHQLTEMRRTNDLTQQALNGSNQSLSETIAQMQEQSDQTGRLADNAGTQATQTKLLARDTHNLSLAAKTQASALDQQVKLLTASQIPFLSMNQITRVIEPTKDDHLIKWSQEWENSGGSAPLDLKIWSDCPVTPTIFSDRSGRIDFYRNRKNAIPVVMSTHGKKSILACEASYAGLKQADDESLKYAHSGSNFREYNFVIGGADYKDFLGKHHIVEFCYQTEWDNRSSDFGFELIPCLAPNDGHNCTDEECKYSPRDNK